MKEYIKIVIVAVIAGFLSGVIVAFVVGGNNQSLAEPLAGGTRFINGLSTDSTAPSAGQVRTTLLTVTGTSTITQSVDGLVVGGTISTTATGTAITAYSNTTGPKMCDANIGYLFVRNNGYAPSTIWSVGTSTASRTTTNLLASSTIATTTSGLLPLTGSLFELLNGDELMVIFGEHDPTASSTHLGNNTAEVGVWCQDISI